jgi:hypothetical protein
MFRCYIHLDNKLFNDHILIRVLQRHLKCIANFERVFENPGVNYSWKKIVGKMGGGRKVFIEPLGGVVIS